jgi:hypothetical protein
MRIRCFTRARLNQVSLVSLYSSLSSFNRLLHHATHISRNQFTIFFQIRVNWHAGYWTDWGHVAISFPVRNHTANVNPTESCILLRALPIFDLPRYSRQENILPPVNKMIYRCFEKWDVWFARRTNFYHYPPSLVLDRTHEFSISPLLSGMLNTSPWSFWTRANSLSTEQSNSQMNLTVNSARLRGILFYWIGRWIQTAPSLLFGLVVNDNSAYWILGDHLCLRPGSSLKANIWFSIRSKRMGGSWAENLITRSLLFCHWIRLAICLKEDPVEWCCSDWASYSKICLLARCIRLSLGSFRCFRTNPPAPIDS